MTDEDGKLSELRARKAIYAQACLQLARQVVEVKDVTSIVALLGELKNALDVHDALDKKIGQVWDEQARRGFTKTGLGAIEIDDDDE